MKNNTARIAALLLCLTVVCLLIVPKNCGEAYSDGLISALLPRQQSGAEIFVPREEAVPVTAEGTVSDLLTPALPIDISSEEDFAVEDSCLRVLIYHTHATEAYRQEGDYTYKESGDYRTHENDKNIVAVGAVLKEELENLGFEVIHDITDHEPPKLSTAYSRSLVTMEKYVGDGIDIYIDLHRDAAGSSNIGDVVEIDGKKCARMMFVVGKGLKSDGTEYDPKPNFEETYGFAENIARNINGFHDGFMRETRVKNGRYNQHVSDRCILAEIGHNMNTLEEAENAVYYLAQALHKTVSGE